MNSALNIAYWFLLHNEKQITTRGADYMSGAKIQKLLYYAQGAHLAIKSTPLFNEPICAWTHGPVVREVFDELHNYRTTKSLTMKLNKNPSIYTPVDNETEELLTEVFDVFGQYSTWKLREMCRGEKPYYQAHNNEIIDTEIIKVHFQQNHITYTD